MDDRIIDFNQLKNKAKDKDVDKLEDYMYSLYYKMMEGKITMSDFTQNIYKYMEENNISQDKFINIQKKLMERYGFDSSMIEEQLKSAGINVSDINSNYETMRKEIGFKEKYKGKILDKGISVYTIINDKNKLEILLDKENITLQSNGKIDLDDLELNEFLCSYKKLRQDEVLAIKVCESIHEYNY